MTKPIKASQIAIQPRNIGDPYAPPPMSPEEVDTKIQEWLATHHIKRSPGRIWNPNRYNPLKPTHHQYVYSTPAGWHDHQLGPVILN